MTRSERLEDALAWAAAVLMGSLIQSSLVWQHAEREVAVPKQVAVRLKASAPAQAAAAPKEMPVAQSKVDKKVEQQAVEQTSTVSIPGLVEPVSAPALELEQPTDSVVSSPSSEKDEIPALEEGWAPKSGEQTRLDDTVFVSAYDDAPGKNVAVIAVRIDNSGVVVESRLVIPSRYPLNDFNLVFAAKQQKFRDVQPPMQPGEYRWIEVRFEYPAEDKPSLIP